MKETSSSAAFLLFLTFLILKLCKVIDWSWWWVTCPLWAGLALAAIAGICYLIALSVKSRMPKKTDPPKSRWEQRYDEMMAKQEKLRKK